MCSFTDFQIHKSCSSSFSDGRHVPQLKEVSGFLEGQLGAKWSLTAALCFYNIQQVRMVDSETVKLNNFERLIRGVAFRNVGLVAFFWNKADPSLAITRSDYLKEHNWKLMIAGGARFFHLGNDLESCQQMTLSLLKRQPTNIDYEEGEVRKVIVEAAGKILQYEEDLKHVTPEERAAVLVKVAETGVKMKQRAEDLARITTERMPFWRIL
ncbi:uncharacterized protein PAC_04073 [Phialocephala subalpina]|uniref:Uncharacterized protein n=1 Tax=Phialocephala subalpina TaxID=576137 RepID=A0A1L7WN45_9HELO|nr:uncharacterized protein PAC_04073 [Phialocephala subalpina]